MYMPSVSSGQLTVLKGQKQKTPTQCVYIPSVSSGQLTGRAPFLNGEELRSVTAVQLGKSVHRHPRCAGHKLQQSRPHLIVEGVHGLESQ